VKTIEELAFELCGDGSLNDRAFLYDVTVALAEQHNIVIHSPDDGAWVAEKMNGSMNDFWSGNSHSEAIIAALEYLQEDEG